MPDEDLTSGAVFRLAKVTPEFPPDSREPLPIHFRFSSAEEDFAASSGRWLLSVWDESRTTPSDAKAIASTPGERLAFRLRVQDVIAIKNPESNVALRVIRHPMPELVGRPGAEGHCGIAEAHCLKPDCRKQIRLTLSRNATRI